MEAKSMFWEVSLELYSEDENGKVKKTREVHLVDAANVSEAEDKVNEEMNGSMSEYKIKSVKRSNVLVIY